MREQILLVVKYVEVDLVVKYRGKIGSIYSRYIINSRTRSFDTFSFLLTILYFRNPFIAREDEPGNAGWQAHRDPSNWTVLDPAPNYLSLAKRNYTHTRLW